MCNSDIYGMFLHLITFNMFLTIFSHIPFYRSWRCSEIKVRPGWYFAICGDGHLQPCEYSPTSGPMRRSSLVPPSLSFSKGAGAVWPLTFSIPLCSLWALNRGLRGAEARAWFSRVKTKRLLKIPRSSHDPRKDLDPTCVRFPFHGLGHTKSTYLADLFCILLSISDNDFQSSLHWH